MRLDTSEDHWAASSYRAFLNGEALPDCVMADEEQGIAEILELEPILRPDGELRGQPIVDSSCPRGVRTRMVWGQVELIYRGSNPEIDSWARRLMGERHQ